MNRRQRRAAWNEAREDLFEDLGRCHVANPAQRKRVTDAILYIKSHSPYDRDWAAWYEDGGDI